jgi:hypothetical protein
MYMTWKQVLQQWLEATKRLLGCIVRCLGFSHVDGSDDLGRVVQRGQGRVRCDIYLDEVEEVRILCDQSL